MSRELPANLLSLHSGEEFLRTKSIEAIQACDDLSRHAAFIERCMDTIDILCRAYDTKDATELIVQHLGARMFNTTASALKLLLSGYYQRQPCCSGTCWRRFFYSTISPPTPR